jgi:hypothetical protein
MNDMVFNSVVASHVVIREKMKERDRWRLGKLSHRTAFSFQEPRELMWQLGE